jgi:hypothetical protein
MALENRNNIELYLAMGELMQHGEGTARRLEEVSGDALARGLRVALVALVASLAEGPRGRARALDLTELLQNELDASFRQLGIDRVLVRAAAALERVQQRLVFPMERDGAPTTNWRPPRDDTQLLPVPLASAAG